MEIDKYEAIWQNIWNVIKGYDDIDPTQTDAFFSRLHPQAFSEGFLMMTADTEFIKTWVEKHYISVIERALKEEYGVSFTIAIEVDSTAASSAIPPIKDSSTHPSEKPDTTVIAEQNEHKVKKQQSPYSFDTFVTGNSNKLAYSMALAVAETPGKAHLNPLFIYGKSGLGKTHLLRSIQNYVNEKYPSLKTVYIDSLEMVDEFATAAATGGSDSFSDFKRRYEEADLLLIDDVQFLQGKNATLIMLFQIFNKMIEQGKQVVLSADRMPKNIDIEERFITRFTQGGTFDIQVPEVETKLGIIRNYIKECQKEFGDPSINLSSEVQLCIAENSSSNIRELKSAITIVVCQTENNGEQDLSTSEVKDILSNHFSGGVMKRIEASDIQSAVESFYHVTHAELVGKSRAAKLSYPRHIGMYLCRTMIDMSFDAVADSFNREHATAMYAFNRIEQKQKESREVMEELEILRQMVYE